MLIFYKKRVEFVLKYFHFGIFMSTGSYELFLLHVKVFMSPGSYTLFLLHVKVLMSRCSYELVLLHVKVFAVLLKIICFISPSEAPISLETSWSARLFCNWICVGSHWEVGINDADRTTEKIFFPQFFAKTGVT